MKEINAIRLGASVWLNADLCIRTAFAILRKFFVCQKSIYFTYPWNILAFDRLGEDSIHCASALHFAFQRAMLDQARLCIKLDSSTRNQTNNVDALLNRVVETTTHVGQVVPSRVMLMMMTIMTAHHPTWETRDTLAAARPTTHPRISKRFNQRFMCTTFRASQKFSNKGASQPSTVLASLNQMNSWQCYARLTTALLSSTFDGLWSWLLLAQCIYK